MIKELQPDGFTYVLGVWPAYDHRNDPEKKQYGQHVAEFHMAVIGPLGTVALRVFTGWTWGIAQDRLSRDEDAYCPAPSGAGVSYHAASGAGEGNCCEFVAGGRCWSEGVSFTGGDPIFYALVREGEAAAWLQLRALYDTHAWGEGA